MGSGLAGDLYSTLLSITDNAYAALGGNVTDMYSCSAGISKSDLSCGNTVLGSPVHALYAKLFGNLLGNFNVEANQLVVFVMVGPGGPGALGAKHDLAALLNLGQQIAGVIGAGSGFAGSIRCRCSRGRCGGTAGGQQGGCQYGSGQCFQFHMCFSLVV